MLIKISKKIAVLLMKLPSLLMAEKIEPKILLIDKAVVTLLIRIQSLVRLKNNLIAQGRYTDAVDDVLCKVLSAKKRKLKIK